MPKRIPTYRPHQSRISVQDVRDTSTPAGAALENEEMRRIALNVNELADKLDKIGGGAAAPAKTTKNISGGGGGGGAGGEKPKDFSLNVLQDGNLKVDHTQDLNFHGSTHIGVKVSKFGKGYADVLLYFKGTGGSALATYENTTEVVSATRIMDFVDGTGTTATVTDGGNGYATVQIDASGSYLPTGDEHETLRKDGASTDDNWIANDRLTNRGDGAVTAGDGVVKVRSQLGDTIPTFYSGGTSSANTAGKFESNNTSPDSTVYSKNYTTGVAGHFVSTTGVAVRAVTSGAIGVDSLSTGGASGYAFYGVSSNTIGHGMYLQGQGTGVGLEVVQNSNNGNGIIVSSTGAGATALNIIGSNGAGNIALLSKGNVEMQGTSLNTIFELDENLETIGINAVPVGNKDLKIAGYVAAPGLLKVVEVPFVHTDTTVDSGIVVPDGAVVTRVTIEVSVDFDGTAPVAAVTINGSSPVTVMTTAQNDLTLPGQYTVNVIEPIGATGEGEVRVTVTTSGSTDGAAIAYVFYSDAPEV